MKIGRAPHFRKILCENRVRALFSLNILRKYAARSIFAKYFARVTPESSDECFAQFFFLLFNFEARQFPKKTARPAKQKNASEKKSRPKKAAERSFSPQERAQALSLCAGGGLACPGVVRLCKRLKLYERTKLCKSCENSEDWYCSS